MWQLPGPRGAGRATSKRCPANKKHGAVLTSASGRRRSSATGRGLAGHDGARASARASLARGVGGARACVWHAGVGGAGGRGRACVRVTRGRRWRRGVAGAGARARVRVARGRRGRAGVRAGVGGAGACVPGHGGARACVGPLRPFRGVDVTVLSMRQRPGGPCVDTRRPLGSGGAVRLNGASGWLWPAGRGLDGRPCACRRTHAWASLPLPGPGGAAVSRAVLRPRLAS